eukprot:CAMPEP_0204113530 /NCGR_PEP_ID=MMETSP0361-20130328/3708_1 /ASSEMBLY_ACC=CAM_ASM_000343 /TAXON_ID=268821 /ORGANISM="Scrippsiella Hangoei, Strain SHTV-5" /LENGTH=64 /DNA_ID=CAMNT_0051063903 /DNA_START=41 /DNA_END=232 /DNA_ORIENTATION=-
MAFVAAMPLLAMRMRLSTLLPPFSFTYRSRTSIPSFASAAAGCSSVETKRAAFLERRAACRAPR